MCFLVLTGNLLSGCELRCPIVCKCWDVINTRVEHRNVGMVFFVGGWGMGDSELKHQHHRNSPYSNAAHRQFLRQHSESYDENEISLIPLGNQVSTCYVRLCTVKWHRFVGGINIRQTRCSVMLHVQC